MTPLRGRVGRHANTGAQCQNWVQDQMAVITLLNFIPAGDGGPAGSIPFNPLVAGVSSDALYNAILRFQTKYFPAQKSGFIEPGGAVIARMETLAASRPYAPTPEPPKSNGQWGAFGSGSVQKALYKALGHDGELTQAKVADIIYATLDNGTLSTDEINDLQMVAEKSKSISPRSKKMLLLFVNEARSKRRKLGPYSLPTSAHISAAEIVCEFLKKNGRGRWPQLDRDEVGVGLLMRLAYPGLLDQSGASLCGPAAYLFGLLQDRPGLYTGLAINLYERGTAGLGGLAITPHSSVRQYSPVLARVDPVDWLTMASLRDSENWFMSYDSAQAFGEGLKGATTQFELAWWLTKAGYSDIREDASSGRDLTGVVVGDTSRADEASRLYSAGYRVLLMINDQMVTSGEESKAGSVLDLHWVVLRSKIDRSNGNVKMTVFTWGEGDHKVPQSGVLPLKNFLMNFHGYVAGKP